MGLIEKRANRDGSPADSRGGKSPDDVIRVQHFSLDSLPAKDRHEAWLQRDWPNVSAMYEMQALEPFQLDSATVHLGALMVSYVDITSQQYDRSPDRLRSYDPEMLILSVMLEGEAHGAMGGRDFRSGAGSAVLVDSTQVSSHFSTASRSIRIAVPRAIAERHLPAVSSLHGMTLQPERASLLISHLLQIRRSLPVLSASHGEVLSRTILDLTAVALVDSAPVPDKASAWKGTLGIAARDAIEGHLAAPDLSTDWLCKRLRVSRSALYRLFEAEGGVQNYIRKRRLEQVRLALGHSNLRMGLLADRWGFHDAAHLSRLFRAAYGMSPSEYRAQFSR